MKYLKKNFENLYELEKNKPSGVGSFVWENLKIPDDVKNILDVGCWSGEFLNSLPDTYEKTGVDIVKEALKNVKCKAISCSMEELPFPSGSFDLVTCFEVLEHLASDIYLKSVREIERVSKKYIAVCVPNNQQQKQAFVTCSYCQCGFTEKNDIGKTEDGRQETEVGSRKSEVKKGLLSSLKSLLLQNKRPYC